VTEEEKHAARIKVVGTNLFHCLDMAERYTRYVCDMHRRHADDPVFKAWLRDMGLTDRLSKFIERNG